MIATGTDVKAIECLVFMRDVRSKSYFEQMKGRGTRTLSKDDLQKVTPDATENKDKFIIVDAVGVTVSKKSDTRPLERKPTVSMKELMQRVARGSKNEDVLTSLANRIIRLNSKMSNSERKEFEQTVGSTASEVAQRLLDAFDDDVIAEKAGVIISDDGADITADEQDKLDNAKKELVTEAVKPFYDPDIREYIENVRRSHDQIIDDTNPDKLIFAGYDSKKEETAERVIGTFREFIEKNKDEITALGIVYAQPYTERSSVIKALKALYQKLKANGITIERLWDSYSVKDGAKVKRGVTAQLTDLITIIRYEMGIAEKLEPFSDRVNYNFMQWTLKKNAGAVHFTEEQMEWLRLIKDHIAASYSAEPDDLELSPFDRKGGLGRFYEVFGEEYDSILREMNVELVA